MKLLRYGEKGKEKPGLLDKDGLIRDLSTHIADIASDTLLPEQIAALAALDHTTLPRVNGTPRIGACVGNVRNFICVGLNYHDHILETGKEIPTEPVLFSKVAHAICGAYDNIIIPRGSKKTDWEVELGVVIGTPAKHVKEKDALNYVAGYCLVNDYSEREFQLEGTGQWIKGKSCDTFGPIGPWLVTRDEIKDPQNIRLWLEVDGKRYQDSNTKEMMFTVAFLVSYISRFFTLHPGDIISTGTPVGVGLGQKPDPVFLRAGQKVRLSAEGLGEQHQTMMDEK